VLLGLGMALEMNFHAFRQKSFAAALTAPGERGAPAFGAHASAETVLLFAGPLRWLVGAFHSEKTRGRARKESLA
jgi:hypothetical protein